MIKLAMLLFELSRPEAAGEPQVQVLAGQMLGGHVPAHFQFGEES